MLGVLSSHAEHEDSGELGRRVAADVGEVPVESHEYPVFLPHHLGNPRVRGSTEVLISDRQRVVPTKSERASQFGREVLIQLEAH